jgi:hypothetical protein
LRRAPRAVGTFEGLATYELIDGLGCLMQAAADDFGQLIAALIRQQ